MAKAKQEVDEIGLEGSRLKKLVIKNFRCIGESPVEIDLDDIVVLVGPNNAGKSTILRAYEIVMNHGSNEGKLTAEDFCNGVIDGDKLPEIELQTWLGAEDKPGTQWIHDEGGREYVRERFIWSDAGAAKRQGRRNLAQDWDEQVPWGAPSVAKARRPQPHRVDAFASPEEQTKGIIDLLITLITKKAHESADESGATHMASLKAAISDLEKKLIDFSAAEVKSVESDLEEVVREVFPGYKVEFEAKSDELTDKAVTLFSTSPVLRMGPEGGYLSSVEKQGSGARRTLLWTALKLLAERPPGEKPKGKGKKAVAAVDDADEIARPNVLLLDEPEICLHPNAIREACRVLYDLPKTGTWQVMVTTHSPLFIDLSKDNTTVVRVERLEDGSVQGTTLFRPDRASLSPSDRDMIRFLNVFDPYFAEFFFGGTTILVEGDTELTAFRKVISDNPSEYKNIHIVRARGKATLIPLIKIVNHFGASFAILHDLDTPLRADGKANGAWTTNNTIREAVEAAPLSATIRHVISMISFESAYLGAAHSADKPYHAFVEMQSSDEIYARIKSLLDALIDHSKPLPEGALEWTTLDDLKSKLPAAS